MKKRIKEYCDWKYILAFILWTLVIGYDECCKSSVASNEAQALASLLNLIVWVGVSFWIVGQGKIYSEVKQELNN